MVKANLLRPYFCLPVLVVFLLASCGYGRYKYKSKLDATSRAEALTKCRAELLERRAEDAKNFSKYGVSSWRTTEDYERWGHQQASCTDQGINDSLYVDQPLKLKPGEVCVVAGEMKFMEKPLVPYRESDIGNPRWDTPRQGRWLMSAVTYPCKKIGASPTRDDDQSVPSAADASIPGCNRIQAYGSGQSMIYKPCRGDDGVAYKSFAAYCFANKESEDPRRLLGCPSF